MESFGFARTAGLGLAFCLAVVRASSSAQSAWTCRWSAAGFKGLFSFVSLVFTAFLTVSVWVRARWYGVAGASYLLLTFTPLRTFSTSFCCGAKWFVSSRCSCQILFSSSSSAGVS